MSLSEVPSSGAREHTMGQGASKARVSVVRAAKSGGDAEPASRGLRKARPAKSRLRPLPVSHSRTKSSFVPGCPVRGAWLVQQAEEGLYKESMATSALFEVRVAPFNPSPPPPPDGLQPKDHPKHQEGVTFQKVSKKYGSVKYLNFGTEENKHFNKYIGKNVGRKTHFQKARVLHGIPS